MVCMFDTGIVSITNRYLTWKIYNFCSLPLIVGTELRSPEFVYDDSRYTLVIWPRGRKSSDSEEWFGICLYKYDAPVSSSAVQFSIVNPLGAIKTCTVECSENNLFRQERFMKWSEFCALSHKIAPGRCLTLVCCLPKQHSGAKCIQNDSMTGVFSRPMNDPPAKDQFGNYQSSDLLPEILSYKLGSPETQSSTNACFNPTTPSTTNSFFSTSSLESSFENIADTIKIQNSDSNIPYSVMRTASGSTFWKNFTRGFFRASKRDLEELDPAEDVSEISTTGSFNDSATSPKTLNLQENSNSSGFPFSDSATESSKNAVEETPSESCPKGLKILSQHLKNLYLEGKNFDLKIIMEGKEFKVLKAILTARSPVFAELLSENAGENTSNIITIDPFDACDSSVFHDFLVYVYSGEIENLPHKNIYGLFSAAHKFELPDLEKECLNCLKTSLSIDTITDVFRIIKNECDLLDIAVVFLARNMEVIMNTDEWKQFMREEPDRAIEYNLKALKIGYMKTITSKFS